MIIVSLFGGLGNQMFQYAVGRVISVKKGTKLSIDCQFLNEKYQKSKNAAIREFELSVFEIDFQNAGIIRKNLYVPFISINFLRNKILGFHNIFNPLFVKERRYFSFQKIPERKNLYLFGYWQSWKYFAGYEEIIRNDFQFKKSLDKNNLEILGRIKATNSVGIHIRFADFQGCNILPKEYFLKAIEKIIQKIPDAIFYVFSTDPDRIDEYIHGVNYESVSCNTGKNNYIDLQLMSNCRHNIISKSSFSWWAAWLNSNPEKIIIAPEKWYNNSDSDDIIPPAWIRI
jgi:hypothetical protein